MLDGLERGTLKARFDLRGAERPDDVVVVAIDAKTFDDLSEQWPFPRSLHGRVVRRLHAAGAREIVYDVQFTEPTTPREDLALFHAIGAAGGAVLATSETNGRGRTNVLGGDANLRRVHARAGGVRPPQRRRRRRHPRSRATVGGLESMAVVTAERAGVLAARSRLRGRRRLDRLSRPARHDPHRLVLRRPARGVPRRTPSAAGSPWWARRPRRCATCTPRRSAAAS